MQEYLIQLNKIEELQMIRDMVELERIFLRAKSTIVQGEKVVLVRKETSGVTNRVNELTTEDELSRYQHDVMKYL